MSWTEFDPFEPTRKPESFWSKLFNHGRQIKCHHPNNKVKWKSVQPVTLLPKTGICKLCGKQVKAKILWE